MGGGQPDGRNDLLHPGRRHPGRGLGDGRPQPGGGGTGGRRGEQLARRADPPQPVLVAPHQGLVAQGGQGVGERGAGPFVLAARQQPLQHRVRARLRADREGLGGLQGEPVQPVQGAHHRGPGPGPGGQLRHIAGHRTEQVRAGAQQGRERRVVTGAQRLGE